MERLGVFPSLLATIITRNRQLRRVFYYTDARKKIGLQSPTNRLKGVSDFPTKNKLTLFGKTGASKRVRKVDCEKRAKTS